MLWRAVPPLPAEDGDAGLDRGSVGLVGRLIGCVQVEFVYIPPEGLRGRMAHGDIYAPEKIDGALAGYFRPGDLTALRQSALLWTADRVDEALNSYRAEHAIGAVWETRERVLVALTGGPEGATLIRRAARIADRSAGGDLLAG